MGVCSITKDGANETPGPSSEPKIKALNRGHSGASLKPSTLEGLRHEDDGKFHFILDPKVRPYNSNTWKEDAGGSSLGFRVILATE